MRSPEDIRSFQADVPAMAKFTDLDGDLFTVHNGSMGYVIICEEKSSPLVDKPIYVRQLYVDADEAIQWMAREIGLMVDSARRLIGR